MDVGLKVVLFWLTCGGAFWVEHYAFAYRWAERELERRALGWVTVLWFAWLFGVVDWWEGLVLFVAAGFGGVVKLCAFYVDTNRLERLRDLVYEKVAELGK